MSKFAVQPHLINNITVLPPHRHKGNLSSIPIPPCLYLCLYFRIWQQAETRSYQTATNTHIYIFKYSPHNVFCYVCAIRMYVCGDLRTNHKRVCNKWNAAGWNLPTSQLQIRHQSVNGESRGRVCARVRAAVIAPLYILSGDLFVFLLTSTAKVVTPHISKPPSEDKQWTTGRYQWQKWELGCPICRDCLPNLPPSALHLRQHLSLSIIWLLSQQINQITASGLCAAAPIAPLVALALICMRSTFYHCYLFNAAPSPVSHLTTTQS